MSKCINSVTVSGNCGADPTKKDFSSSSLASVNIAVNESYLVNNQWQTKTNWIKIKAWKRLADVLMRAKKGDKIVVSGKFSVDNWTDQNGQQKKELFVQAFSIDIIPKSPASQDGTVTELPELTEDDLWGNPEED